MPQQSGSVLYNGEGFNDFFPERTAAYVDQVSQHPSVTFQRVMEADSYQLPDNEYLLQLSDMAPSMPALPATGRAAELQCSQFCMPKLSRCIEPDSGWLSGWHRWTTTSLT